MCNVHIFLSLSCEAPLANTKEFTQCQIQAAFRKQHMQCVHGCVCVIITMVVIPIKWPNKHFTAISDKFILSEKSNAYLIERALPFRMPSIYTFPTNRVRPEPVEKPLHSLLSRNKLLVIPMESPSPNKSKQTWT